MFEAWLRPRRVVHAHCDLPCGVYDPAQAKIEAQSVKACMEKYHASDDPDFKAARFDTGFIDRYFTPR